MELKAQQKLHNMDELTYCAGLELLKERAPDNVWIKELSENGFSFINAKYLEHELNKLPRLESTSKPKRIRKDSFTRDLRKKRISLFGIRSKLSNKFHSVDSDDKRSEISTQIKVVQDQIKKIGDDLNTYLDSGKKPNQYNSKYPVPESDIEKLRKRLSLRSSISRKKSELKKLHEECNNGIDVKMKINKFQESLSELQTHLHYVEESLKA